MQLSTYLCPPALPARAANEGGVARDHAASGRRPIPSAAIVPLPQARPRRSTAPDERRGEILLFLGVRYERRAC
ncbi:hypothetical protein [Methylobacterium dankookense]|uniref:Uncharacterized protein n=1 Tax=Methylobacterium dankookense TaxID=560405 RepID=A0A564FTQ2_9HYPH|nr:hypothetical protein [Methylobacterium dankookense]GJD56020.1 hypothetical protein IFDJLNFL_1912 [Methylobacterium dankookense]VUF11387.1 hypothetical protein MTDSW087_01069 [Methylobacterium dankookense]